MSDIVKLDGEIFLIDLDELGEANRNAAYLIKDDAEWMLIETGPESSHENILEAVKVLGIHVNQIKYIGVTHVHIDHAGGLGRLCRQFRQAEVVVHPLGKSHLVDPSKLIAGATSVWGRKKMKEYGEVLPVEQSRIMDVKDGFRLRLNNRLIEIWYTPGHAKHHLCFYDQRTKGLFSGDAAGIYQPLLSKALNKPVIRTTTSDADFNAEMMLQSLKKLAISNIERIYFTHFGPADCARLLIEQVIGQLTVQLELVKKYVRSTRDDVIIRIVQNHFTERLFLNYEDLNRYREEIRLEYEYWDKETRMCTIGLINCLKSREDN